MREYLGRNVRIVETSPTAGFGNQSSLRQINWLAAERAVKEIVAARARSLMPPSSIRSASSANSRSLVMRSARPSGVTSSQCSIWSRSPIQSRR